MYIQSITSKNRRRTDPIRCNSREVLGLYRKREGARCLHEHGVLARFRYNDLKEAALIAADAGLWGLPAHGCGKRVTGIDSQHSLHSVVVRSGFGWIAVELVWVV